MTVTIRPSVPAGAAAAPPSKSMAHRLLICAGYAIGKKTVRGVALSEDIQATMDCLRALEVDCEYQDGDVTVSGYPPHRGWDGAVLPCRESGSTLRFFIPMCLFGPPITLTGSRRLLARPLDVYEDICKKQGILFEKGETELRVQGKLSPGEYELPGDVSSQFASGLLFELPVLDGDSVIRLTRPVESRSYIDMTMDALRTFGVRTQWLDETTIEVPGRQDFYLPDAARHTVIVEGDWSNAAFFLALGASVTVTGLNSDSLQGDKVCVEHFERLKAGNAEIDLSDCPDLGPVLFAYAAMHHGGVFTGTRRLRIKESDRGAAMWEELRKFGVPVEIEYNRITVGNGLHAPSEILDGHNDHRIVMALSVLCAQTGGTIAGAEAVNKSFPDFFKRLKGLEIKVKKQDGMDF